MAGNTIFQVVTAKEYPGSGYHLVTIFDALHDMGDPAGACSHILTSLKDDGTFMLVEPAAGDALEDNLHVLGQIYYSFSTLICTPASRAQEVGLALGAQAGEKRLTEVLKQGGFSRVRRAAETPRRRPIWCLKLGHSLPLNIQPSNHISAEISLVSSTQPPGKQAAGLALAK